MKVHIWGSSGRLGSIIDRQIPQHQRTTDPAAADCWVLAVPTDAAHALLQQAGQRTVIDLSVALKTRGEGRYALLDGRRLIDGQPPRHGDRLANPGCFASSVIVGLRRAGIDQALHGPLHISAVGGKSTAHRSQDGGVRLSRRRLDHPHVTEIQRALPGTDIASFSVMIAYAQPAGILSITSGTIRPGTKTVSGTDRIDFIDVVGTARLAHQLQLDGQRFTLAAAIDNVRFPVDNALRLIAALSE